MTDFQFGVLMTNSVIFLADFGDLWGCDIFCKEYINSSENMYWV